MEVFRANQMWALDNVAISTGAMQKRNPPQVTGTENASIFGGKPEASGIVMEVFVRRDKPA